MQLFPHQQRALEDTQQFKRVAYYLDMGLGKTFVGSEKANSFSDTVFDLTDKKQLDEFTITIGKCAGVINYDLVFRRSYFAHISGFTLMLDESSIIQNEVTKRSKFILKIQPFGVEVSQDDVIKERKVESYKE